MAVAVEQVAVQADWLTYVAVFGTLVAGVAALAAVVFSFVEAKRGREDALA